MSSIINKVKDVLHHDHSTKTTSQMSNTTNGQGNNSAVAEGVNGPHNSRTANAADPRIDSDMDHRANPASGGVTGHNHGVTGHSHGTTGGLTGASTGTTGGFTGGAHTTHSGVPEGAAGPHSSRIANAADPRIDSDRDNRAAGTGGFNSGATTGHHNNHTLGLANHPAGTTAGTTGGLGHNYSNEPQHSSNMANKLDPRVDSTYANNGQTHTSTVGHAGDRGGLSNSTNAGPHNANVANKLDPRVDSTGGHNPVLGSGSHATAGSGRAQNTQGPHNSDMLNKLDPRVDADGDGSKTYGGNKTFTTNSDGRDPTNAAHVPPSVLAETLGQPTILHGDKTSDHYHRHGSISQQERHI